MATLDTISKLFIDFHVNCKVVKYFALGVHPNSDDKFPILITEIASRFKGIKLPGNGTTFITV